MQIKNSKELREYINDLLLISSKSKLCKKAKITRPTLDNFLSDEPKQETSKETIIKLCEALGFDSEDLKEIMNDE